MKNTHIEHPDDSILTGDLSVLDWFVAKSNISAKIDGAPAIVWGTNPATGNFFVGTKSVFNKVKIKINESHEDIDTNHQGNVATILHKCLDNLPRTDHIFQGDFVGFGGNDKYTPNTIAYSFADVIDQKLIITPHTKYTAVGDLRNAVSYQLDYISFLKDCVEIDSDEDIFWFSPFIDCDEDLSDIVSLCDYAQVISGAADYMDNTTAKKVIISLNSIIASGLQVDDLTLIALADYHHVDINVLRLWKLVQSIKHEFMLHIATYNEVDCYINGEEVGHEGYVLSNDYGTFKLIYREVFSNANFNRVRA